VLILGIDPGITNTGYGLVSGEPFSLKAEEFGSIKTQSSEDMSKRLDKLYKRSLEIIEKVKPEVVVLEELFFSANAKTAFLVGQARGVILLACEHAGVPWTEYAPLEVKKSVAGTGGAPKSQVKYMVTSLLKMEEAPSSTHECDALALAICHAYSSKLDELMKRVGG